MTNRTDVIISGLAALLVLFTAMLDPRVSVGLSVVFLLGLAVYKVPRKGGHVMPRRPGVTMGTVVTVPASPSQLKMHTMTILIRKTIS